MAIVYTDNHDYAPGSTANITGEGFVPGSVIEFIVQHIGDPGADEIWGTSDDILGDNSGAGHEPWYVIDGGEGDLDGEKNGAIKTTWHVNPDDSLNAFFRLTALGAGLDNDLATTSDNDFAETYFTDAGNASANLDQWQNGPITSLDPTKDAWVNGNLNQNNSHYFEGDYVPYRTTFSQVQTGSKYWVQIEWDTTQGANKHSEDYIGTYDASFVPLHPFEVYPDAINGGPGTGDNRTVGSSSVNTLDVPDDPRVIAGEDGDIGTADDVDQGDGVFTIFAGTFAGFALPGADGVYGPTNYSTGISDDLLLKPGTDNVFNTNDDQLVNAGSDGEYDTADDIVQTGNVINGADGDFGTSDDNNPYVYTGTFAGSSKAGLVPVFTYNGTNNGNAIMAWGGHIATDNDWGSGNSAYDINGSPYHMRGIDFIAQYDSNVSWGNQDRSLKGNVIIHPASITIEKQTEVDGSAQWFNFSLTRPVNTVDIINGSIDLSGDSEIDTQDDGTFVDSGGETFIIVDGEIVSFSEAGTVNTYYVGADGLVHSSSTAGPIVTAALNLTGTGVVAFSLQDNQSITFDGLIDFAGYTIKEKTVPQYWDLTSINRSEDDPYDTGDVHDTINNPSNDQTSITLTESDAWNLTFNNAYVQPPQGNITIQKYVNTDPNGFVDPGDDYDSPLGLSVPAGSDVYFHYVIEADPAAVGQYVADVTLTDDNGTPLDDSDDLDLTSSLSGLTDEDDDGDADDLAQGAIATYSSDAFPAVAGQYTNIGTATGSWSWETGSYPTQAVTDPANYFGADAYIELDPLTATNRVGDSHTVTATVWLNDGVDDDLDGDGDEFEVYEGATVAFAASGAGADPTSDSDDTDGLGEATFTFNSDETGLVTTHASTTITVGGLEIELETDGEGLNSDDAEKTYVDAYITINPPYAENPLGSPHTLTATIWVDDGDGVDDDGENGTYDRYEGAEVYFSNVGAAEFVADSSDLDGDGNSGNDAVTDGDGNAVVDINSYTAGLNTITATSVINIDGVEIELKTDGSSTPSGAQNSDPAEKLYYGERGNMYPTNTDCHEYLAGSPTFEEYYAYQGGVIQYGVRSGLINQTNPGVFFYYTGASGAIYADDASPITLYIDQSDDNASVKAFTTTKSQVKLYKVTDVNHNGMVDSEDSCTTVALRSNQITLGNESDSDLTTGLGDVKIVFTPTAGSFYVASVKYSTGSVVGTNVGSNSGNWPTVDYTIATHVNNAPDGTPEEYDTITLAPKAVAPLTVEGGASMDSGAATLANAALQYVAKQAIDFWVGHGANAALLGDVTLNISDLGGDTLGEYAVNTITIDDDAAGYGWSYQMRDVDPSKVDLYSAVVHEFGHALGYDHSVMGESLAVGERVLPEFDSDVVSIVGLSQLQDMYAMHL